MTAPFFGSASVLEQLSSATCSTDIESLLSELPIVSPEEYAWDKNAPEKNWVAGKLHWVPVGRDRGNAGRIKLAGEPMNPLAERLVNGMEAIIELERQIEKDRNPQAPEPTSPRDAVLRYFDLPRLDLIPTIADKTKRRLYEDHLREVRKKLQIRLTFDRKAREFAVSVSDEGIGQTPDNIHATLLSLGQTDKADKRYMIGVFGQGGSSSYAASNYSVVLSRRAPEASGGEIQDVGWSVIKQVFPETRRDPYFAYLAAAPQGRVPRIRAADAKGFRRNGTSFIHVGYDFGATGSSVARVMYQSLNHVLFSPVLPYELFALKNEADPMYGTAQRLARQIALLPQEQKTQSLDKPFDPQPVGKLV